MVYKLELNSRIYPGPDHQEVRLYDIFFLKCEKCEKFKRLFSISSQYSSSPSSKK